MPKTAGGSVTVRTRVWVAVVCAAPRPDLAVRLSVQEPTADLDRVDTGVPEGWPVPGPPDRKVTPLGSRPVFLILPVAPAVVT
jgi:hypothetical protein